MEVSKFKTPLYFTIQKPIYPIFNPHIPNKKHNDYIKCIPLQHINPLFITNRTTTKATAHAQSIRKFNRG